MACQSASRKIVVISGWVEREDEKEAFLAGGWERGRETVGPRSKGRSWGRSGGWEEEAGGGESRWGQGVNALHCTSQGECMLCVAAWVVGRKAG